MQKILLIDDEPQVIQDILYLYGYDVEIETDGYSGIQNIYSSGNDYDLVVLDLNMPKMDGWSVLKAIRGSKEHASLPVMMLSANDQEESVVTGLRRGADEYLTKPLSPSRLLAQIEAIFRRSQWDSERSGKDKDPELAGYEKSLKLLTVRENEILAHLVQGMSNSQIGEKLVISETTVKNHLAHIFKKLKVSNRTQAAYIAQKLNIC